jgi:cystathionine gamma-synthase/methionine-gamma-lyase
MADQKTNFDIATELVHRGERKEPLAGQPTSAPIYATATYTYESMDQMDKVFGGELPGYVYTRHGNPTVTILEDAMRVIESGDTARAYGSGMAALHAALFACELSPGAVVLASQDLYGATTNLLLNIFGAFGIKTAFTDFSDLDALRAKANEVKPRVMIAETISNPPLKVCDIDTAEIAHRPRALDYR